MRILVALFVLLLTGCAAYRIVPIDDADLLLALKAEGEGQPLEITRVHTAYPEGLHCFEPMLFLLTIGLVPMHCISTYTVSLPDATYDEPVAGTYKVTLMQGWVALLLAPMPSWRCGYGQYEEIVTPKIRDAVLSRAK